MMKTLLTLALVFSATFLFGQQTYPVNGSYDTRPGQFAFTNATIVVNANQTISNGTLLIKGQTIQSVGQGTTVPKGYVVIDLKGKFIYPSLIDPFTSYGLPEAPRPAGGGGFGGNRQAVFTSPKKGAYNWNEAIRPETEVSKVFGVDGKKADDLRKLGFGSVNAISRDGIARGTSAAVTLSDEKENKTMLNNAAAANYSFNKGTSQNDYPTSLMGSIALLRQTYYDAAWYGKQKEEYNISLEEFNKQQQLPQIFEADDWQNVLRADKIAKEFGKQYIIKSGGDEYQRIDAVKATGASLIVPLNFAKPFDVQDPAEARNVTLAQMKSWEMAPSNPAVLEKAGIKFSLTAFGLDNVRDFWTNVRAAIENGLTEKQALLSLTEVPASMIGIADKVGTLEKGKLANFLITSDNLFKSNNIVFENWVQGKRFVVSKMNINDLSGIYNLNVDGIGALTLKINGTTAAIERTGVDSVKTAATFTRTGDWVSINFNLKKNPAGDIRLSGYLTAESPLTFRGESALATGTAGKWSATYKEANKEMPKRDLAKSQAPSGKLIYPFGAFGNEALPVQETVLLKNATVWTNEKEGVLLNADVLLENGKIKAVGKGLSAGNAKVVDATGKHITAGIIDEHSHIAIAGGVNEGAQSSSAEVRVADVVNSEDVNIYRQLAGGVTTSHLLHGSANPIGGQSQLIKLRWGKTPEELKFAGSDGFIKFALGENVKQSNRTGAGTRFPVTRMGVEQSFVDDFTRAKEYKAALAVKGNSVRRDLELDAIVEILDNKRFITCHSYVQSEINMLIHVADSLGFKINTFTHILEGYKVADKMKAHGINGSTFSDWWAYKMEVAEAIPYNGKIMHNVGITTAFNSDDAEMARRLNQEAGKAVLYGNVPEEEALKFVTLNPAKMLHVDNRVGSLKPGKDADVVIWSANPLSIYARAEKTYVDGIAYWDLDKDAALRTAQQVERARITKKMLDNKSKGASTQRPVADAPRLYNCESLEDYSAELNEMEGTHSHE
jgi:imidazolonepropionase-like amidohydrolase